MDDYENDDNDKPMNMEDEQAKNNIYDENMDNDKDALGNSKNDVQYSNRYTLVDNNFDEEKSRENSIGANEIKKESNLLNENDFIINDSNANSKRVSRQSNRIGVTFIDLKIILLGDVSVGKTSIIGRYINSSFEDNYKPNVTAEKRLKVINEDDNTSLRMNIWDTAGQDRFKTIAKNYYKGANAVIFVFDVNHKNTIEKIKFWINSVKDNSSKDIIEIIVGNKIDIEGKREVTKEQMKSLGQNVGMETFETSAKTGEGINEIFNYLVTNLIKNPNIGRVLTDDESSLRNSITILTNNNFNNKNNHVHKCNCKK